MFLYKYVGIVEPEQNDLKRGLSGLMLITLQSHIDMVELLNGGTHFK
jgi:hypothetical protein